MKMSSILPSKNTPNSERLSDLNTKVRSTCVDHDVLFVDNDVNFTFRNGAVDDAAFQRDGIHLSESGTGRLLRNLDLPKQPLRRKQWQRHKSTRRWAIRVDENNQQQQRQQAPPALRREAATLVLGRRVCQHDHLLHDVVANFNHRKRLKSRRPLTHHAQQLVSSAPSPPPPQETVKHWTHARWAESCASTITRLHKFIPTPSNSGQGVGLSRRAWTRLNRP